MGRLSEYDQDELDIISPTPYEPPQYSKGFAPGSWATVRDIFEGANLHTDVTLGASVALAGTHCKLLNGERVMVISRPGWGNPWISAHLGVVYVLVARTQRCGWMWAASLKEDVP